MPLRAWLPLPPHGALLGMELFPGQQSQNHSLGGSSKPPSKGSAQSWLH